MTSSRGRIAFIYPTLTVKGGAENLLLWLILALRTRGHDAQLFTGTVNAHLWPADVLGRIPMRPMPPPVYRWGAGHSKIYARRVNARTLAKALPEFDVVCPWNGTAMQYVHLAKAMNPRIGPIVFVCQEPTRRWFAHVTDQRLFGAGVAARNGNGNAHMARAVQEHTASATKHHRKLLRNAHWEIEAAASASVIVANSRFSAGNIETAFARPAEVVYPGIPTNGRPSPPARCGPAQPYIGCVGYLSARKNVHNVIQAFTQVRAAGLARNHVLRIVGAGPERQRLEQLAADNGLNGDVRFHGFIADAALDRFYQHADAIVYAPIDEPFGLVPLEAAAHEVPVIVPDHGGPREVFSAGRNAHVVDPLCPDGISEAIRRCILCREEARAMAANARELVAAYYHVERYTSEIEDRLRAPHAGLRTQLAARAQ